MNALFLILQLRYEWSSEIVSFIIVLFTSDYLPTVIGPIESDDEYKIIVDGNNITVEIDNEIS